MSELFPTPGGPVMPTTKVFLFLRLILYIKTDWNGRISDMKWQGEGCILSVVSTDMFCENAIGKEINSLKEQDDLAFVENFPIKISPGRINCVMLPLRAFRRGTKEK